MRYQYQYDSHAHENTPFCKDNHVYSPGQFETEISLNCDHPTLTSRRDPKKSFTNFHSTNQSIFVLVTHNHQLICRQYTECAIPNIIWIIPSWRMPTMYLREENGLPEDLRLIMDHRSIRFLGTRNLPS